MGDRAVVQWVMVEGNGRYQIKKTLARSKVATLYLAEAKDTGETVVIKQFAQLWRDEAFAVAFSHTLTTLQAVAHEAIAPIYDFGERNGQLYLAMPYYPGGSLAAKLANGPLSLAEMTPMLARVCGALEAVQRQGVMHHHLTPENVLFDAEGNAYLSDFGVVHDQFATFAPDPRYASPEEAANLPVDARTNVYHLGLLLFQLLTGRVPFEAPTPSAILQLHRYSPAPSVRTLNASVPAEVEAICRQALAKRPEERFATVGDLLAAWQQANLSAAASRQGVGNETAVSPPPAPRPFSWLWLGLGILLLLTIGGIWWWRSQEQTNAALEVVPTATAAAVFAPTNTPFPPTPLPPTATLTATPSATPTSPPTPLPSKTARPTATATTTATATASRAATPFPTASGTPFPLQQTITLGPPSGTVRNPVTFSWTGSATATYRVVLAHEGQVFAHNSGWIQGLSWTFSFPAEQFGGWSWYVEDQLGSRSANGFFWFNEFSGGDGGDGEGNSPTAVPTDLPPPP